MPSKVKLFEEVKSHLSNEEKAQRKEAKKEMFEYAELSAAPPVWIPASAKTEWDRIVPLVKKDMPISELDYSLLVAYCLAFSRVKTCENEIRKYGTFLTNENTGMKRTNPAVNTQSQAMKDLKSIANSLGMTLEARQRMALNKAKSEKPTDPFEQLMKDE